MTFRIRGYRENHGEALFLGIIAISQIIIWLVWIAGTLTSTPHYRDGFVAFGVVGNATLVFMIMFVPKGRQLAAVGGRDALAGTDRIDQLSTASSPSIYAPSFLHIKTGSNFVPLSKAPSLANSGYRGSVGAAGLISHGNSSERFSSATRYHLYQKFHGSNETTSPTGYLPPDTGGTNSTTITQLPQRMSNSYSSHAIFNFSSSNNNNSSNLNDHHHNHHRASNNDTINNNNDDDDPNYSNLSNIFTTSSTVAVTSSNDGSKTSPLSENISSHSSGSSMNNNGNTKPTALQPQSGRPPSVPKSKRPTSTQIKSPNGKWTKKIEMDLNCAYLNI